jgi:palmitoyl-protein thioesterase
MCVAKVLALIFVTCLKVTKSEYLPILIWHGLLADPTTDSLFIKEWIRNETSQGIYIKSVDLTINELHESEASVFVHPLKQIDQVCSEIKHDEKLRGGFNAIGMSQGGQFM